jgi:hypothetical protein
MPGLVPGIHVFLAEPLQSKAWMAGTSPAMTELYLQHYCTALTS